MSDTERTAAQEQFRTMQLNSVPSGMASAAMKRAEEVSEVTWKWLQVLAGLQESTDATVAALAAQVAELTERVTQEVMIAANLYISANKRILALEQPPATADPDELPDTGEFHLSATAQVRAREQLQAPRPEWLTVPTADPVCRRCGHKERSHNEGYCYEDGCGCQPFFITPEPVCQCGHVQSDHIYDRHECGICDCRSFTVPTAQPAPLDPVLTAIRDLYVLLMPTAPDRNLPLDDLTCLLRHEWRSRSGEGYGEFDTDRAIRSYGAGQSS